MEPTAKYDVVVVGGSYAGLAAALALAETLGAHARIAVADRGGFDPVPPVSDTEASLAAFGDVRASALASGSRHLLTALGVWPRLAAVAQPVTAIDITDSSLDAGIRPVLLSYDNRLGNADANTGAAATANLAATHIVPNNALRSALLAEAKTRAGLTFLSGRTVTGFHADVHAATLAFDDGSALQSSLIVAADGRRSALRTLAGIKSVGWPFAQRGIVTVIRHELPHGGRAVQHFLPAGPFAILPLTGDRSCITWTEGEDEARRILAMDDAGFLGQIEHRFGGRLGRLTLAGGRQSWPLDMHLARALVANRLALVGDAVRGVHPIAGQGLNLGFRDIAALAEVAGDAAGLGLDIGSALTLERYERWRRADGALSAASFDVLNRLFASDWSIVRTARDAGLGLIDRSPMLKRWLVTEAAGQAGTVPRLMQAAHV